MSALATSSTATFPLIEAFGQPRALAASSPNAALLALPNQLLTPHPLSHAPPLVPGTPAPPGQLASVQAGPWLAITALANPAMPLEQAARSLYTQALELVASRSFTLVRAWHYIPRINTVEGGLECYRHFNVGRWTAFLDHFGKDFQSRFPAASAVGTPGDQLAVALLAIDGAASYCENPLQIPAYHYPPEYGPRAPGFVRACLATPSSSPPLAFLSGTAAIRGHLSQAHQDLDSQIAITLENIAAMLPPILAEDALDSPAPTDRWRVYLRHPHTLARAAAQLAQRAPAIAPYTTFVAAELCRANLDIEIEATLTPHP
jgi:chorismate lyase / 3-hydroxybenzoate synthase